MWRSILVSLCLSASLFAGPKVTFVIGIKAPPLDQLAAEQLSKNFQLLFDAETTVQTAVPADTANVVLIGSPLSNPAITAADWPKITEQGIVLKSTKTGLIVGGGCPPATMWAASELSYRFGIRHLLQGDVLPIEKPTFTLGGFDAVMEPKITKRGWSMFNGSATGADSWGEAELVALLSQLVKLKFTHVLIPLRRPTVKPIAVDGDTAGRKAFGGAKQFPSDAPTTDFATEAKALGLVVLPMDFVTHSLGARTLSVLPQFSLPDLDRRFHPQLKHQNTSFMAGAVIPGDLNAAAHFISRVSFDDKITAPQALNDLVTPICGEGVVERLQMGFDLIANAAKIIEANDSKIGVPDPRMFLRHLESKEPLPAWIIEVKTLYTGAMNEMYRANTRARGGARPYILYHAKRLEFALHYFTALESLYKAHDTAARAESLEAVVEATYNALNAYADVARDPSDRGVIALLNEYGYRVLLEAK